MKQYSMTKSQARRFLLLKQGLIGEYKFTQKNGILDFVKQAGCIQYDPIDVCGKNSELTLQSRIEGFQKSMLYDLLYEDRLLMDYFDKNLAITSIIDWPYLDRIRKRFQESSRSQAEVEAVEDTIKSIIREKGPVCSKDIDLGKKVDWYWSNHTNLSRVALETLYFRGELIIHHKKGTIKYYALAEDYIPSELRKEKDPNVTEAEYLKWRALRRISAVGLLWNKPSDAFLFISNLKSKERNQIFEELISEDKIRTICVTDIKDPLYCLSDDSHLIEYILENPVLKYRIEFLAPLDNMLWDRKLIKSLFDFDYKWEIYTPVSQRKYGYYVLPILHGEQFIGRAELINNRKEKTLQVKNVWLEPGVKQTKKLKAGIEHTLKRFAAFNDCRNISKD